MQRAVVLVMKEAVGVTRSRLLLLAAVTGLAAALLLGAVLIPQRADANQTESKQVTRVSAARTRSLGRTLSSIISARDEAWRWQSVMSAPRTPYAASAEHSTNLRYREQVLASWRQRAVRARQLAQHPPRLKGWLCIHHYEGAWNDPNPPYYGGLQMDITFQRAYGSSLLRKKGTADRWTPLEQIWVAERAYRSGRGFWPWPNTARYCGLL
jgi:hypothetical protein